MLFHSHSGGLDFGILYMIDLKTNLPCSVDSTLIYLTLDTKDFASFVISDLKRLKKPICNSLNKSPYIIANLFLTLINVRRLGLFDTLSSSNYTSLQKKS